MMGWFVSRGGHRQGPFTFAEIQRQAAAGQLGPQDGVWPEHGQGWVQAASIPGLFPHAPPVAPQPYASPQRAVPQAPNHAPPARPPQPQQPARPGLHIGRAFAWNLRTIEVLPHEEAEMLRNGVDDPAARAYLAWRRSLLLVITFASAVTAIVGIIDAFLAERERMTNLGIALVFANAFSLVVMPVSAWAAGSSWSRHKRSRRTLTIGWTISFLLPLLFALLPVSWRYDIAGVPAQASMALQLLGAVSNYVTLMPTVLALIPGIMRACLRVKVLLPQSMLPGWFLVGASPLWVFLFLVMFAIIDQVASEAMLIAGVVLLAGAPIIYLFRINVFTKPITDDVEFKKLLSIQTIVRFVLGAGLVLLGIWLFAGTVFDRHIIGLDDGTSFVRPWDTNVLKLPLEFMSHSLFTVSVVADLIMAMNLAIWQHSKAFLGNPQAAADYDRTMSEIDEAGTRD
ncbi:MAG: DUF4339 domain-containing protein [Polyangiaceae bacterium]